MNWKQVKYGLDGLVVIPRSLQAYLLIVAMVGFIGLMWIVGALMPYEPFKFYGWTNLPEEPVCPAEDVDGSFKAEVVGRWYCRVGAIRGDAYWVDENNDPLPGVTPIHTDLVPTEGPKDFPEASNRIAPLVDGTAKPAWDADITGLMFGIVPVHYNHRYVATQNVTILPISDKRCET